MNHAFYQEPTQWQYPARDCHPTFFPQSVDDVLKDLRVTKDDLRRWKQCGWLSFDVDLAAKIDIPQEREILFIRQLAVSGLADYQIERLLAGLHKPYCYDLDSTAYHFSYGWVTPVIEKPFDVVDTNVEEWLSQLADEGNIGRLKNLAAEIAKYIESLAESGDDDSD